MKVRGGGEGETGEVPDDVPGYEDDDAAERDGPARRLASSAFQCESEDGALVGRAVASVVEVLLIGAHLLGCA